MYVLNIEKDALFVSLYILMCCVLAYVRSILCICMYTYFSAMSIAIVVQIFTYKMDYHHEDHYCPVVRYTVLPQIMAGLV